MNEDVEVEIVVVEDDPNDAELILRVLKKHNLANKLVHLEDGAQALDYLLKKPPSKRSNGANLPRVVLLDLKLPKVDGLEILRQMKADERAKKIPVVILTSSREDRDIVNAYALGVNSYVTKPIRFDEFAKVVSDLGMYWVLMNKAPHK
ncbi:MAG TPA: response regulator [Methanomassiliicoccales archaeon]|nr:response regulator [Methanomassiliicoccales archaeon]